MDGAAAGRQPLRESKKRLLLLGNDQVFDLVVRGLWNDLLLHQVGLLCIGAAINDLLGVGGTDARKCVELVLGRAVDVDEIRGGGSRLLGCGGAGLGMRNGNADAENEDQSDKQHTERISLHAEFSLNWYRP